jgi:hypothetical protein
MFQKIIFHRKLKKLLLIEICIKKKLAKLRNFYLFLQRLTLSGNVCYNRTALSRGDSRNFQILTRYTVTEQNPKRFGEKKFLQPVSAIGILAFQFRNSSNFSKNSFQ